jgi:hypothetical protein
MRGKGFEPCIDAYQNPAPGDNGWWRRVYIDNPGRIKGVWGSEDNEFDGDPRQMRFLPIACSPISAMRAFIDQPSS